MWTDPQPNTVREQELEFAIKLQYKASNNEAEYEALLQGLRLAEKAGAKRIKAYSDSQLVAQQLGGHCEIKEDIMKSYVDQIKELEKWFTQITVEQIARSENQRADFLAKIGSSLIYCIERKITVLGVGRGEPVFAISDDPTDWRLPLIQFLEGKKPELLKDEEILERRARFYYLIEEILYRKTFFAVDAKCLYQAKGILVLKEAHGGMCRACGVHTFSSESSSSRVLLSHDEERR